MDRDGHEALTFRALAEALHVTPMAVAYHVGTRDQLLAKLVAHVYAGVSAAPSIEDPRQRVRALLRRYCERVVAHPKLTAFLLGDLSRCGDELTRLTAAVRAFVESRRGPGPQVDVLMGVIIDYTHGFAFSAAANPEPVGAAALTVHDYLAGLDWLLDRVQTSTTPP